MKLDLKSMTPDELATLLVSWGEKPYRAKQLFEWLHQKQVRDFAEMTTLSRALREKCAEQCSINSLKVKKKLVSALDDTVKYLYELADGNCVETVLMQYHHGASLCLSTQVGCRMGCRFCASTQNGLVRSLTAAEMLDQVYASGSESRQRISSIVLMGIGEPLDNFDNVVRFLELISHPDGMNLSLRHVSLSTCGLADRIEKLAELRLGLTLSVSLHAVTDEERSEIMPVNRRWPIDGLLGACRDYFEKTGRRISFEYALIEGRNDDLTHAGALAGLLGDLPCHINLIPVNPVPGSDFRRGSPGRIEAFRQMLEARGLTATVRRELGADIMAACGQLRAMDNGQWTINN